MLIVDIFSYKMPDIHSYTHSSEKLRNYFILFVCCSVLSIILKEVCTLQMKSLGSSF